MTTFQNSSSQDDSNLHACYLHHDSRFFYHQCIATFTCQSSYISSLVIEGQFLYTGSSDKEIRLWNRNGLTSRVDEEYLGENMVITGNGAVKSMVILADKLYTAHQDHKIRVWKISTNEMQQNKLTHLATLPTLGDRALKLLIPKHHVQVRRHRKSTWVHHLDTVSALALSNNGLLLYSVSWDRAIKIWQRTDFKCLESIANAHDDAINALVLSNNGDVYTGSTDKKIKIWRKISEGEDHTLVATLEKHKSGVNALALSNDQKTLYSCSSDSSILVWDKNTDGNMVAVGALKGHTKSILCLTVISDLVCSGSADETIRIWRGIDKCYSCLAILEGHKGPIKCLTLTMDYNDTSDSCSYLVYSGGLDYDIKVWQICVPSP